MVKKYAHMDAGHLAQFANAVTFWAQQTPEKEIATGKGGDSTLINKENSGGASLIIFWMTKPLNLIELNQQVISFWGNPGFQKLDHQ